MKEFLIFLLIGLVLCDIIVDSHKQTKLNNCAKLVRARLKYDSSSFEEVIEYMITYQNQKNDKKSNLISMVILTCFERINNETNTKFTDYEYDEIDPFDYKELLGLDEFKNLYTTKTNELEERINRLSILLEELKNENLNFTSDSKEEETYNIYASIASLLILCFLIVLIVYGFCNLKKIKHKKNK